eukprot:TRINITY_DN4342_c0_g1_i7.p1 TRINITY_DN4342_c0_g1~~TRINITY_DN4342_c0_g1_i7.p1  ORF type:complete len:189 (+),score=-5.43 TRINITY_DN4342_c0_g1_i7:481-1047(+)
MNSMILISQKVTIITNVLIKRTFAQCYQKIITNQIYRQLHIHINLIHKPPKIFQSYNSACFEKTQLSFMINTIFLGSGLFRQKSVRRRVVSSKFVSSRACFNERVISSNFFSSNLDETTQKKFRRTEQPSEIINNFCFVVRGGGRPLRIKTTPRPPSLAVGVLALQCIDIRTTTCTTVRYYKLQSDQV